VVTGKPQQKRLSSAFQGGKGNRAKVRISALIGALSAASNVGEVATTPPPYACVFPCGEEGFPDVMHWQKKAVLSSAAFGGSGLGL